MPTDEERSLSVALARLEGKLDSLITLHKRQSDDLDDHESRLRTVEQALHNLASRDDIEEIERKRDAQMQERQRKTLAWVGVLIALIVPIEAAIVAAVIQSLGQ